MKAAYVTVTLQCWFCAGFRRRLNKLLNLTWIFSPQHGGWDLCVMNILSAFYYRHYGFILTTNVFSWCLIVELWWETAGGSFTCTLPSFCVVCSWSKETSAICEPLLSVFTLQDAWKNLWCPWIRESHLIHVISKLLLTWCSVCLCEEALLNCGRITVMISLIGKCGQ